MDSAYVIETPEKLHMSIFRRLKIWMTISEPKLKGTLVPSCYSKRIHVFVSSSFFWRSPTRGLLVSSHGTTLLAEEDRFLDLGKRSHFALSEFVALHAKKNGCFFRGK